VLTELLRQHQRLEDIIMSFCSKLALRTVIARMGLSADNPNYLTVEDARDVYQRYLTDRGLTEPCDAPWSLHRRHRFGDRSDPRAVEQARERATRRRAKALRAHRQDMAADSRRKNREQQRRSGY